MDTPRPKGQPLRPIRVLLFSTLYPSASRPQHGIFVETRLRELLKTGAVDARVIAPVAWFPSTHPRHGEKALMAATPQAERRHGVEVWHPRYPLVPKFGMTLAPLLMALACIGPIRRLKRQGFDFELIDAHYYYPDGVAAALLARWFGRPLSITARGTDLNLITQYALPRRMIYWAAAQAQVSVGVCKALMEVLRVGGADPVKLHVLRNGVDLQRFRPEDKATARRHLGLPADGIWLLSVGHLIERKGHDIVIQALALLPQARLALVGAGPQEATLRSLAQHLGVADRVRFVGLVPNEDLRWWYSAADVLALCSDREGWANVLLESMACGTPVVASDIWGTPEVVAAPEAGELMPQRTAQGVCAAYHRLLARRPDRAATRRYAEGFSWQATTQGQLQLFRQILEGESR